MITSAWAPARSWSRIWLDPRELPTIRQPGVGDEVRGHDGGGNGDEDTHGFREANAVKSDEAVASDASEERGESERREEREVELRRVRSVRGSRGMAGCIDAVVHVRVRAVMARITVAFPSEIGVPQKHREQQIARAEDGKGDVGEGQQGGFLPGFVLEKRCAWAK